MAEQPRPCTPCKFGACRRCCDDGATGCICRERHHYGAMDEHTHDIYEGAGGSVRHEHPLGDEPHSHDWKAAV